MATMADDVDRVFQCLHGHRFPSITDLNMNEIVWVAFISAGGALAAAVITQCLSMRAVAKQAARVARQEALQWQRSEVKRKRELQDARLREMWVHVMTARAQMTDALANLGADGLPMSDSPHSPAATTPATAAAHAYAVALLGLPEMRESAKAFYKATASLQVALGKPVVEEFSRRGVEWFASYKTLEERAASFSDALDGEVVNPERLSA